MNRFCMKAPHAIAGLLPLISTVAFAAAPEHGAERGGEHHAASFSSLNWTALGKAHAEEPALLWLFVTFVAFAFIVVRFARPALRTYLEERAHTVEKAIAEAKDAKAAAEARAQAAEAKLAALSGELVRLKGEFRTQGEAESARIEEAAKAAAARIQKDAEDTIAAETERARQVLREEASRLAIEMAEERIKTALSASDDQRLVKSLVSDLAA